MSKPRVKLGDEVKDKVTGFRGIVTSMTLFLNGCTRCGVQPVMGKDGKIPDGVAFDEPQLEIIKAGKVEAENSNLHDDAKATRTKTGGPMFKSPVQQRAPSRR